MDPVLSHLLRKARSAAVKREFLKAPAQQYTASHEVTLLAATYNVNGRMPTSKLDISEWLAVEPAPDIVAVGFQEIVPLSASNVVMGAPLEAAAAWDALIMITINRNSQSEYVQVAGKQMVGLYLSVWVSKAMLASIRGVQVTSVGTGVMGYLGNKGAVAVRMRVYDTSLCLINAHLSSGEAEGDCLRRHSDFSDILRRAVFPPDADLAEPNTSLSSGNPAGIHMVMQGAHASGQWGDSRGLLDSSHVIWMGDLNYRINMADERVRQLLQAGNFGALSKGDELQQARRAGDAFKGWSEGSLTFPPTYKFRRGSSQYVGVQNEEEEPEPEAGTIVDKALAAGAAATHLPKSTLATVAAQPADKEKRRTPAWTDRVLWRAASGTAAAHQMMYSSLPRITMSDHRPVHAAFMMPAREYVRERVDATIEAARRTVDAREMEAIPRCELDPVDVDLGDVHYAEAKSVRLLLRNVGQVAANFQWMPLPSAPSGPEADGAQGAMPPWASITPMQGEVEPGAVAEMSVRVLVNGGPDGCADQLASSQGCKLDAILVLHIQGGNDIFCSLFGSYRPSFFGVSLPTLANLPRPLVPASSSSCSESLQLATSASYPKESDVNKAAAAAASDGDGQFWSPMSSVDSPLTGEPHAHAEHFSRLADVHAKASTDSAGAGHRLDSVEEDTGQPSSEDQDDGKGADTHLSESSPEGLDRGKSRGHSNPGGHTALQTPSVAAQVPLEVRALVERLRAEDAQHLVAAFVSSAEHATAVVEESVTASDPAAWSVPVQAVHAIRSSLDRGRGVPSESETKSAAATLLAFFAALPRPLMPPEATQVCEVCVPSAPAASSLLADAMPPPEWAVFRHVTGLLREALATEDLGKQIPWTLAALLAELWFPRGPKQAFSAAGRGLRPEAVADLQRLAEDLDSRAQHQAAFVARFLEPAPH